MNCLMLRELRGFRFLLGHVGVGGVGGVGGGGGGGVGGGGDSRILMLYSRSSPRWLNWSGVIK